MLTDAEGNKWVLHKLIFPIVANLFASEAGRLQKWVDVLSNKDRACRSATETNGFIFVGRTFTPSWVGKGYWPRQELQKELHPEGMQLVHSYRIMENDQIAVRQGLVLLLGSCETLQDVRDALPECLVAHSDPEIKKLSRTRETGFSIADNPRKISQYEAVLPLIQVYSVANMIY